MSPLTLRRYLLDSRPVTWWDLDPVNEPDVMADIDAMEPGQTITLGMCTRVERLPDAPFGFVLEIGLNGRWVPRLGIACVGPDDVGAATGLEVPAGIDLEQRARVHAATSVDDLRALPFVIG